MAHPKRRQSKSRRNKRRSHFKIKEPLLAKCPLTKQKYLYHHAYWHDNKLYYRGKIVYNKNEKESL
ncbi:50S ribosomal protein L32 [Blattabacterium sp. (Nauphoeta cinerea)]|uniref:50S ribosomal protein L32 n=1 Tax=Blattabacterium sp. (Nauphoeta cinerea) TaxID=1316444 RepID=UPI0003B02D51|nr:50S ribosomal protein L32 [Blattabacterium sp. (Nauphoeta cinerea)]AGW86267.1 50S ribosomal protein L32 [Blattabacterium sp. (Nauphoeta cinerea)]